MYGYVKTYRPELKCRESDFYRAAYCGLCRAQGRCTGQCSRLTLSYDMTFFALFRMALTGEVPVTERHRCPVHPLKKRPMLRQNDALTHAAAASALLIFHKLRDDLSDETGAKLACARLLSPLLVPARRRADRMTLPAAGKTGGEGEPQPLSERALDDSIGERLRALSELEARRPASVDEPAQLFGELMADVLAFGLDGSRARLAREIGLRTGRWVYILDAADDYAEDVRRGRYNPFVCLYAGTGKIEGAFDEQTRRDILQSLDMETASILSALDLMDTERELDKDTFGIIRNVLSEGMPRTAHDVLFPPEDGKAKKSKREGMTHT